MLLFCVAFGFGCDKVSSHAALFIERVGDDVNGVFIM